VTRQDRIGMMSVDGTTECDELEDRL